MPNKKGVVKTPPVSYAEVMRLQKEVTNLRLTVTTIGFRILFSRDVLEQAGNEVERRGRMTPQIANDLKLQILILENIMKSILCLPQEAVTKYRAGYLTDEFATAVKTTADGIAPIIIIPAGVKARAGKFTIN